MIYLFDDKRSRQTSYGWSEKNFEPFSDIIMPIYTYHEIIEKEFREKIFSESNTILFHESFFDNSVNQHSKSAIDIRNRLSEYALEKQNFKIAYFSGSKQSRLINSNIYHLPVFVLYQNLEFYLNQVEKGEDDLRYLLYGKNYGIEEILLKDLHVANERIESSQGVIIPEKKCFIAQTLQNEIDEIFDNAMYETFYLDAKHNFDITDQYLDDKIHEWFTEVEYDCIYIPLCFGPILSDFNGLRFALHIRTTQTPNQNKNILLYSFVDYKYIIDNPYFDVLKTDNITLIEYTKEAFNKSLQSKNENFDVDLIPQKLKGIKLEPPKSYYDNHSIANEWAIYRWAKLIDANNKEIKEITNKLSSDIYFKFLRAIYPICDNDKLSEQELKFKQINKDSRILLIDDEAERGWFEILCHIISDINGIEEFDYLGLELRSKSQDELIEICSNKIKENDIDVVILDFRITESDHNELNVKNITGYKILEKIKKINPGIQVIVFSATNKVWNLVALQNAGADGFIVKESPENSMDYNFTRESINKMIKVISNRLEMTFLKRFYNNYDTLEKELLPRKKYEKTDKPLPKEFVDEVLKWFKLSIDNLNNTKIISDSERAASFLFLFSVLENLSTRIINVNEPIDEGRQKNERKIYKYEFRGIDKRLRNYVEDRNNEGFYRKTNSVLECGRSIPWNIKILNTIDFITEEKLSEFELNDVIKRRNDFIHSNTTTGEKFKISQTNIEWLHSVIYNGLLKVK